MAYNVLTGEIIPDKLYSAVGAQSVTYNSITYGTGQTFRGVLGVTAFTYSGSGSQIVNEVTEVFASALEYVGTAIDIASLPETTLFLGIAVEFSLTDAEKIVNEITNIKGFAIELIDYPFYSFEITETR